MNLEYTEIDIDKHPDTSIRGLPTLKYKDKTKIGLLTKSQVEDLIS